MVDFEKLKANRKKASEKLKEKIKETQGGFQKDERFWKADYDKTGKAYHIIRFLPDPDQLSFEKLIKYSAKGPGGWYINNSWKTFGKDNKDPVAEAKNKLYSDYDKKTAIELSKKYEYKRQERFFANILVEKDSEHPENEGKVFLYEFGLAVYNLINKSLNPVFEDDESVDVFDMWEGAPVKLKLVGRTISGSSGKEVIVPNYDNIEVGQVEPLGSDEEIEAYWKQTHPISEFVDKDKFKPIEELYDQFNRVMGYDGTEGTGESKAGDMLDQEPESDEPKTEASSEPEEAKSAEPDEPKVEQSKIDASSDDDVMAFFEEDS